MSAHSPTPWRTDHEVEGEAILGADDFMVADCAIFGPQKRLTRARNQANAALIVRAVNSHDALVSALEAAIAHYDRLGVTQPWMPQARTALAAAATQPAGR